MLRFIRANYVEITGIMAFAFFMYLISFGDLFLIDIPEWIRNHFSLTHEHLQNMSSIFFGVFIEGIPFILVGVLVSSLIHVFVKEEMIWRFIPNSPLLSIPMAACLGLILPICECGIVPVARRLIQKGVPHYVVFTFLLAAPIINPITITSTYIAFGDSWEMVGLRLFFAGIIAIMMGSCLGLFFSNRSILKEEDVGKNQQHDCSCENHCDHSHSHLKQGRISHALYHSIFEFIDMSKYFILGGLIAAAFQTWIGITAIKEIASDGWIGILLMMGLAFGLSICSSADAFIASSFRTALSTAPLLAFLIYGPMMDIKNVLMLSGSFRWSVVSFLFVGTTSLTFILTWLFL
ncbi:permease [Thermoflavimicrobium daqui]|nr:permease [Thermoflavimicrobium daqui]